MRKYIALSMILAAGTASGISDREILNRIEPYITSITWDAQSQSYTGNLSLSPEVIDDLVEKGHLIEVEPYTYMPDISPKIDLPDVRIWTGLENEHKICLPNPIRQCVGFSISLF